LLLEQGSIFATEFNQLTQCLAEILDQWSIKQLSNCRKHVYELCVKYTSLSHGGTKRLNEIKKCKTFSSLFVTLSRIVPYFWNWEEHSLLVAIIERVALDKAKVEFESYTTKMATSQIISNVFSAEVPPNCIPLHVVLGKSYTSLTVDEYLQLKHVLCTSLNIEQYTVHPFFLFLSTYSHFIWYVPKQAAQQIITAAKRNKEQLLHHDLYHVKMVKIDVDKVEDGSCQLGVVR